MRLMLVFESSFLEGMDTSGACPTEYRGPSLRTIPTQEPFEVLYPLFYYLYTDCIHFTTAGADVVPFTDCCTPPCDAQKMYAIAHRFGLDKLEDLAFEFLVDTCDETNILPRVFGAQAE